MSYRKVRDTLPAGPVWYIVNDSNINVTFDDIIEASLVVTFRGIRVPLMFDAYEYLYFEDDTYSLTDDTVVSGGHLADKLCDMLNMLVETRIDISAL